MPVMKRLRPNPPDDLSDAAISKWLRRRRFEAVCQMLDACSTPEQRKRLARQRAQLERRLGYESSRPAKASDGAAR